MSKISFLGQTMVLSRVPSWTKGRKKADGFIIKRMPETAYNPTKAQARVQLIVAELGSQMEGVSDINERNRMVQDALTGKTFTTRDYKAENRANREATISRLRRKVAA